MNRISEPSTWAGAGVVVSTIAPMVPPQYAWIASLLTGLFGTVAVALREKAKAAP